ncbi:MAG: cache domain-containing protein [Syntrophobacteraceae bacterium]
MMKVFFRVLIVAFCAVFLFSAIPALAQKTPDELAKESEDACLASASTKPTPQMVMDKVGKAAALLEKEGKAAFPKFRGKDSEFIFAGTYMVLQDLSGRVVMHPLKYKMEGQNMVDLKDSTGKLFFIAINEVAKTKGAGWVDYMWPKPGETTPSLKISYVKLVKADGEDLVIVCGIYDVPPEEIQKLVK